MSLLTLHLLLLLALGGGLGRSSIRNNNFLLLVESRVAAGVLEHVGKVALAAIVTVEMHSHEGAGTALLGALLPQAGHLARGLVDAVVLEHRELDLLMLGLDLLGLGVSLLLTLLSTANKVEVAVNIETHTTSQGYRHIPRHQVCFPFWEHAQIVSPLQGLESSDGCHRQQTGNVGDQM